MQWHRTSNAPPSAGPPLCRGTVPWLGALAIAGAGLAASIGPADRAQAPAVAGGRATSDAPVPVDPRLDAVNNMLRQGAFGPAAIAAATVLRERPELDRAAALLGIALDKLKRYDEARPYLRRAMASGQEFPERRHAAHFLGWCCYHLGELEESRAAFERHLRDVPGEPDSTFGLGLVALAEDRVVDAQDLLMKSLEGFSKPEPRRADQARVLVRLADVALRRDEVAWAEELLGFAVEAGPTQHEAWAKLARVRDRLGKHEEAELARANERRILEARGRIAPQGSSTPASDEAPVIAPSAAPVIAPSAAPVIAPSAAPGPTPPAKPADSAPANAAPTREGAQ